jgi:hypothetical protein
MTGSTLLAAVYGYEVTSADDPLVRVVQVATEHFCDCAVAGSEFHDVAHTMVAYLRIQISM